MERIERQYAGPLMEPGRRIVMGARPDPDRPGWVEIYLGTPEGDGAVIKRPWSLVIDFGLDLIQQAMEARSLASDR